MSRASNAPSHGPRRALPLGEPSDVGRVAARSVPLARARRAGLDTRGLLRRQSPDELELQLQVSVRFLEGIAPVFREVLRDGREGDVAGGRFGRSRQAVSPASQPAGLERP